MLRQRQMSKYENLVAVLQRLSIERRSCILQVRSIHSSGMICLDNGILLNARTGRLEKENALAEMLSWENPEVQLAQMTRTFKRRIFLSLEELLAKEGEACVPLTPNVPLAKSPKSVQAKNGDEEIVIKPSLQPRLDIIKKALQNALMDSNGTGASAIFEQSITKWATLGPVRKKELPVLVDILSKKVPEQKKRQFFADIQDVYLGVK